MLGGFVPVSQSPLFECVVLDLFSFAQCYFFAPEAPVSGCQVLQAFVVTNMIVVVDEALDAGVKVSR